MSGKDLYDAANRGDEQKVKQLLQRGVHPEQYRGVWGWYALHKAALNGHTSVVRSLLQAGAQVQVVTDHGETALHLACNNGDTNTARLLLEAGAVVGMKNKHGDTALHDAARWGRLPVVQLLVEKYGGDTLLHSKGTNNETPKEKAQTNNHTAVVTYLQQAEVRQQAKQKQQTASTNEVFNAKLGDYNLNFSEPLGHGTYGEVYRARHINGGDIVALKRVRWNVDTALLPVDPKKEVETYRSVPEHPNILKLLDSMLDDRQLVLVTEICDAGDLERYFIEKSPLLTTTIDLMEQASCGLLHLHSQKPPIVHRDIKPQNLLIKWCGTNLLLKIADFGFARPVDQSVMKTLCGTLPYIAPDVLPDVDTEYVQYTKECDIFSLGLVFQAMVLHKQGNLHLSPKLDVPSDPNKGPAQQMRDAKKNGSPIPGVAHIGNPKSFVLEQLDSLVQWMTKYAAAERVDFNTINYTLKGLKRK